MKSFACFINFRVFLSSLCTVTVEMLVFLGLLRCADVPYVIALLLISIAVLVLLSSNPQVLLSSRLPDREPFLCKINALVIISQTSHQYTGMCLASNNYPGGIAYTKVQYST